MSDRAEGHERAERTHEVEAAVVARVRASFARQGAMATLGAELAAVAAGRVAIALPIEPRLFKQDASFTLESLSRRWTALAATRRFPRCLTTRRC